MFKKVSAILFLMFALLSSPFAAADEPGSFAEAFQRAMSQGKAGNAFAAGYTCTTSAGVSSCTSPYGGSISQNYSQWSPTGGTTSWSYNNFTIVAQGITMVINGSFTFTGTVANNGALNGTMTGNLNYNITTPAMTYGGYSIPASSQQLAITVNATFANGNANITMTANGQTITAVWSQGQLISYLY